MYRWLLKNNIEIYEYKPTILHGKLAFYDDKWTTAGSYNVNNISAYASVELNLDVSDERFTKSVRQTIENIIEKECIRITEAYFVSHTNFFQRIWQKICSDIVRLIFYIFTFYFKQEH
jgi:cardiolipin synthase